MLLLPLQWYVYFMPSVSQHVSFSLCWACHIQCGSGEAGGWEVFFRLFLATTFRRCASHISPPSLLIPINVILLRYAFSDGCAAPRTAFRYSSFCHAMYTYRHAAHTTLLFWTVVVICCIYAYALRSLWLRHSILVWRWVETVPLCMSQFRAF